MPVLLNLKNRQKHTCDQTTLTPYVQVDVGNLAYGFLSSFNLQNFDFQDFSDLASPIF